MKRTLLAANTNKTTNETGQLGTGANQLLIFIEYILLQQAVTVIVFDYSLHPPTRNSTLSAGAQPWKRTVI